jgi:hypothetical protein
LAVALKASEVSGQALNAWGLRISVAVRVVHFDETPGTGIAF